MKTLQILVLIVLTLGFSLGVKAQICGPSFTKIFVRDNQGNIIKEVKFEFVEANENTEYLKRPWLIFDKDGYVIFFGMDYPSPEGNQLLKISAVGFEPSEQTIFFRQPQHQIFSLTLKRKGTKEKVYFEELLWLRGRIKDTNGGDILGARVVLTDNKGKKTETLSHEYGYSFEVPEGIYDVKVLGTKNFASTKYEKFEVSKKQTHLDIVLKIDSKDVSLVTELVCKPSEYSSSFNHCVLTTKNPNEETQK